MRLFDQRFGADFLAGVPTAPGVYRFLDAAGALLYVGKSGSLRRRLAQYRTAGRKKNERKRRALVKAAATITWEVCASDLAASLTEIRLIQTLRPRRNVASAFPFLYPYIGIRVDGRETFFCLTTGPEAFPSFDLHGAFRSRDATGEAFHALARLLRFIGHPIPRARQRIIAAAAVYSSAAAVYSSAAAVAYSMVVGFRRLPVDAPAGWSELFRGASREALEALALELLEHPGAIGAPRGDPGGSCRHRALFRAPRPARWPGPGTATGYSRLPGAPAGARPALRRGPEALRAAT